MVVSAVCPLAFGYRMRSQMGRQLTDMSSPAIEFRSRLSYRASDRREARVSRRPTAPGQGDRRTGGERGARKARGRRWDGPSLVLAEVTCRAWHTRRSLRARARGRMPVSAVTRIAPSLGAGTRDRHRGSPRRHHSGDIAGGQPAGSLVGG